MFENFITENEVYKEICQENKHGKLAHAILLVCDDREYLKAFAINIAKVVLCNSGYKTFCNDCNFCEQIEKEIHPDLHIYGKEKPMNKDDAENIIENLLLKPYSAERKIYLLLDYDEVNSTVENKLLKSIEEPPEGTTFILCVKNESKLLQTTISRTHKYNLSGFLPNQINQILKDRNIKNPEIVSIMSNYSLENAISLAGGDIASKTADFVLDCLKNLNLTTKMVDYSFKFEQFSKVLPFVIDYFVITLRDCMIIKSGNSDLVQNKHIISELQEVCKSFNFWGLTTLIEYMFDAKKRLSLNTNSTNIIDQILLKILEVKHKCKKL